MSTCERVVPRCTDSTRLPIIGGPASPAAAAAACRPTMPASPLMLDQADRVVLVEDGRVVAEGTHRELLRTSDAYRWTVTRGENI